MATFRTKYLLLTMAGAVLAAAIGIWIAALRVERRPTSALNSVAMANPDVGTGTGLGNEPAPGFSLTDQNGRPTSLHDFRGKVVVLAFVDSHCTTVCPLMTESMIQALRLLGSAASQVQLLGIDANPRATQVADVAAYTRAHHMEGRWRFLTGPLPELEQVWRTYHVYVAAVQNDIDHQPVIFLIDGHGRERMLYVTQMSYEGVQQQAELLAQGISHLLPGHPTLHDRVSLAYIQPLGPASVVRLVSLGKRAQTVVLGKGHPHLLLFFAGWLAEDSDVRTGLTALDSYAVLARQHGWPPPAAINELATEGSASRVRQEVVDFAARLHTPVVEDAQGRLGDGYGVQDLPWFVLTSPSGRVLWHHDGWLSSQALAATVRKSLRAG